MRNFLLLTTSTAREIIRGKILLSLCMVVCAAITLSSFFGSVTIGEVGTVVKDLGCAAISLANVVLIIVAGGNLLAKEIQRRTVFVMLAKPISRTSFLLSKFAALLLVSSILTAVTTIFLMLFSSMLGAGLDTGVTLVAIGIMFENILLSALVVFFASFITTPALIGILTTIVFLAGRNAEYLLYFVRERAVSGIGEIIVKGIYRILPKFDFSVWSVATAIGESHAITPGLMFYSLAYVAAYTSALLLLSLFFFTRRDFN